MCEGMNWLTIHVFKRQRQQDKAPKNASISQLENLRNTRSWYKTTPFSFPLSSQCNKRSKSSQLWLTQKAAQLHKWHNATQSSVSVPRVPGTKQKLRIISSTAAVRLNCIANLAPVSCHSAKMAAFWHCFVVFDHRLSLPLHRAWKLQITRKMKHYFTKNAVVPWKCVNSDFIELKILVVYVFKLLSWNIVDSTQSLEILAKELMASFSRRSTSRQVFLLLYRSENIL